MLILPIFFVTSAQGYWTWSEDCICDPIDDGLREAVVGYDKNLTSLMDPGEGCRWIFKSGSTVCCYSDDTDQCAYQMHDEKKCRKNHTEFIVRPAYPTRKCDLQLFNIDYKDKGEYTQTTRTFNFTIKLTVTRNTDWDIFIISVLSIIAGASVLTAIGFAIWKLKQFWERRKNKKRNAIWGLLKDENEESFLLQSKTIDVWRATDKDGNNLLHLMGMMNWTEKKTDIIFSYCQKRKLLDQQIDSEENISLQSTDKIMKIVSSSFMKNIVNVTNMMDETPLHIAVKYGKRMLVEALLTIGNIDVNATDQHLWTPLHLAASKGHTDVIKILLDREDIEKDAEASDGRTPLLCAGSGGKDAAFELLVEHKARLNVTTEDGENILHIVSKKSTVNENKGKIEILNFLFNNTQGSASQVKEQMKTESFTAISCEDYKDTFNSIDTVKSMESMEYTSVQGTPLEIAVSSGFFQAARLLIENGADFMTKLVENKKPEKLHLLLHAVLKGDKAFADFLLRKDPNLVNATTKNDETYLHVAIKELNVNAVRLLLKLKIDKGGKNSEGQTALEFAEAKLEVAPTENKLHIIIFELSKEENDVSRKAMLENIQKSTEKRKQIEQKIKDIEVKKSEETEVYMKQLKKVTREERNWKEELKELDGQPEIEERDQNENKRENPTMEKIQNRVINMINSETNLTIGQMAQVLNILNDVGIPTLEKIQNRVINMMNSETNLSIGQMAHVLKILNDVGIQPAKAENRFLRPDSKANRLSFQSD